MINNKADLKRYLHSDLDRYDNKPKIKDWILHNEKWYIWQYIKALRFVEYYLNTKGKRDLRFLLWWYRLKHLGFKLRYTIYPNTIDEGLAIYHTGDFIFIKEATKIGKRCTLRPGVVIGNKSGEREWDMPVEVGDNVEFGLGVRVFGKLHIGNNVTIGANSVVTKDIEDNAICAGLPAKVIRIKERG